MGERPGIVARFVMTGQVRGHGQALEVRRVEHHAVTRVLETTERLTPLPTVEAFPRQGHRFLDVRVGTGSTHGQNLDPLAPPKSRSAGAYRDLNNAGPVPRTSSERTGNPTRSADPLLAAPPTSAVARNAEERTQVRLHEWDKYSAG